MIVDRLENLTRYASLHPLFAEAARVLQAPDFAGLEVGKHEILGQEMFVNVQEVPAKTRADAPLEAHRRYIDIQVPLSGDEEMGYTNLNDCGAVTKPYSDEKDVAFFEGAADSYVRISRGMFAIFFPEDAHAPGITPVTLKKVIMKIKL